MTPFGNRLPSKTLVLCWFFGLLLLGAAAKPVRASKPNFVIIFTDDQGYQDVGCFGSPDIRTPRLDAMAEQGMRFSSFYAQPICGPSRAALMTGCHLPSDHGGSAGPLRSGKVSTFEGGVRVPVILWAPGRAPAGTVCDTIATTMDVLPTFAALAGAKVPTDRVIDGKDIQHLFHGDFHLADPNRTYFYYLRVHLQAVRQGKWKLHLPRDAEPVGAAPFSRNNHIAPADRIGFDAPFLVDLDNDLGETTDVAADHPEIVSNLLALAESIREDLGDYDQVGENMRFFDAIDNRPTVPPLPTSRKRTTSRISVSKQ
ncbi:MAG: sulfatase-like hydrolase/transferase [Planctomycetota bacterium]